MQAAEREQLSAAAYFVWSARRDDDDFNMAGPGFRTEAEAQRECMTRIAQSGRGPLHPDTPVADLAALCLIAAASSQAEATSP